MGLGMSWEKWGGRRKREVKGQAHKEYREAINKGHEAYLMDEEALASKQMMHRPELISEELMHELTLELQFRPTSAASGF